MVGTGIDATAKPGLTHDASVVNIGGSPGVQLFVCDRTAAAITVDFPWVPTVYGFRP